MRRKILLGLVSSAILAVAAVSSALAAPYAETGDAGDLPGTAQNTSGSGDLTAITGTAGGPDADMYRICLTGGGTFSATTVGGAGFDTQLFLFDSAGMGIEANDDTGGGGGLQSTLSAGGLSPAARGVYHLAISRFDNDPVSLGGQIFPDTPLTAVVGPTGPGGGQAISGWTGTLAVGGAVGGPYQITLTGARFCAQQAAAIDIKPGSDKNPVNLKSKGVIPVAVLTTPDFDAATVDVASVCFGDAEAAGQRACDEAHIQGHLEDVDGDGDLDLMLHFRTQDTGIDAGDTQACLTGTTSFGESIADCDSITITP
jgi:hypothetical protein